MKTRFNSENCNATVCIRAAGPTADGGKRKMTSNETTLFPPSPLRSLHRIFPPRIYRAASSPPAQSRFGGGGGEHLLFPAASFPVHCRKKSPKRKVKPFAFSLVKACVVGDLGPCEEEE